MRTIFSAPLGCLLLAAVSIFLPSESRAANHYILPSPGAGNHGGSDWSNACSDFTGSCAPGSLVRGDTYYVGSGSYTGGYTFNVAVSGTLVITVKGATVADHGTATGWSNAFSVNSADGGSQATFGSTGCTGTGCKSWMITTNYWLFDGNVGSGSNPAAYGFNMPAPNCSTAVALYTIQASGNFIDIKHLSMIGCGSAYDIEKFALTWGNGTCGSPATNDNVSYTYFSNYQNDVRQYAQINSTIEYTYHTNGQSTPAHHGEHINAFCTSNITVRYNILDSCAGTACIAGNIGAPVAINNWAIYGNLFSNPAIGNGIIGGTSQVIANTLVYNNTFAGGSGGPWFYQGNSPCSSCTGNVLRNNIVWNHDCSVPLNGGGAVDADYDTFLSCTATSPSEAHGQTGSFNPFVNSSSKNYQLAQAGGTGTNQVNAGISLTSPYNLDMYGNTRGTSGTWDRGAFEYIAISANLPAPPQSLVVLQIQ